MVLVKDKLYCVYKHTSLTGKSYIGMTCHSLNSRCGRNGIGYLGCGHFYRAIKKYGWDSFTHKILINNLNYDEACSEEQRLIILFRTQDPKYGYNLCAGGAGVKAPSDVVRKKMKDSKTPETRAKISYANSRPVIEYFNGEEIEKHASVLLAGERVGLTASAIACYCSGKSNSRQGTTWRYADEVGKRASYNNSNILEQLICYVRDTSVWSDIGKNDGNYRKIRYTYL